MKIPKREFGNPLVEPNSALSSVLDEVDDEFRLTIFKMKPKDGSPKSQNKSAFQL